MSVSKKPTRSADKSADKSTGKAPGKQTGKRATQEAEPVDEPLDFESSLSELESIVEALELGKVGLTQSLEQFETGVKHLKQCYRMLDAAEKRVAILTGEDEDGNPQTEPFSDADSESLAEKADNRSRRRTASRSKKPKTESSLDQDNVDAPRGLF